MVQGPWEDVPAAKWHARRGTASFICTVPEGRADPEGSHTPHPTRASSAAVGSAAAVPRGLDQA